MTTAKLLKQERYGHQVESISQLATKYSAQDKVQQSKVNQMLLLDHFQNCTDCPLVALGGMQVIMLEGANATAETVAALRTGAMTMKALQKTT